MTSDHILNGLEFNNLSKTITNMLRPVEYLLKLNKLCNNQINIKNPKTGLSQQYS